MNTSVKENVKSKKNLGNLRCYEKPKLWIIRIEEGEETQVKVQEIFSAKLLKEKFPNLKKII